MSDGKIMEKLGACRALRAEGSRHAGQERENGGSACMAAWGCGKISFIFMENKP